MAILERVRHFGFTKAEWDQLGLESTIIDYSKRASRSYAEDTVLNGIPFEEAQKVADTCGLDWGIVMDWRFYMKFNPHLLPRITSKNISEIIA